MQAARLFRPISGVRLAERMGSPVLSNREREVLQLLPKGTSNQESGAALQITEGTVKSHVNSILSKLNVADRTRP